MTKSANILRLGYIGKVPTEKSRDSDSWFTPVEYLDSVRGVLGQIDLDPFSSREANQVVRALNYFTLDRSAYEHNWTVTEHTRVYMNPPYSARHCGRAVNYFIDQFQAGNFYEGIVLVNNSTDTKWFEALVAGCDAICFTDHRIAFWSADHKNTSGNPRGQAFFYFGPHAHRFARVFEKHGSLVKPFRK